MTKRGKSEKESLWALFLIASPVLALYLWSIGLGAIATQLAVALIVIGALLSATDKSPAWQRDVPLMLLAGTIQLLLILPISNYVNHG